MGEVWLCSGQSNMEMTVGGVANRDAEIAAARHPQDPHVLHRPHSRQGAAGPRNGRWVVCSPQTVGGFSAAAYFFGRELHKQLHVPVGLINSSWGGTPIQTWTSIKWHEAVPELKPMVANLRRQEEFYASGKAKAQYEKQLADWEKAAAAAKASGKDFKDQKPQPPQDPALSPGSPAALYNGMIAPLAPYAIRGAIWYQGESNAGSPIYGIQLKAMIANWREDWRQGDFPFLFVQLPNFMGRQTQPSEAVGGWPLEREQFLKTLDTVNNTGMAVTIDIGDATNIHPLNKQDVGKRLAQWALAKTYGKDVVASGPLYKSSQREGGQDRRRVPLRRRRPGRARRRQADRLRHRRGGQEVRLGRRRDRRRQGVRVEPRGPVAGRGPLRLGEQPALQPGQQGWPARLALPHRRLEVTQQPFSVRGQGDPAVAGRAWDKPAPYSSMNARSP